MKSKAASRDSVRPCAAARGPRNQLEECRSDGAPEALPQADGEHAALLPADYDALVAGRAETEGTAAATRKKARKSPVDVCVEVRACHTRVDVIWQDGTTTNDAPATTFSPAKHVDGYYEFWPQDFVVGKTAETGSPAPPA